ncbi:hypothetical protein SAMD00023353_0105140 [Rosellinia necatrix]|uniref:Uncharacterized protein n=1 Tax=Rosellinia necatrix TaxID=77044 RepID=A0A1S8A5Y3_ROSNE|nr:hypothetical protein SAMD00023353_0105140 [Rosellinia necatrix]
MSEETGKILKLRVIGRRKERAKPSKCLGHTSQSHSLIPAHFITLNDPSTGKGPNKAPDHTLGGSLDTWPARQMLPA